MHPGHQLRPKTINVHLHQAIDSHRLMALLSQPDAPPIRRLLDLTLEGRVANFVEGGAKSGHPAAMDQGSQTLILG